MNPYKVLFVCWGNICRSPAAECVFQKLIDLGSLGDRIACDSAGTIDAHAGHPPDARMRDAATRRSIRFFGKSRKFRPTDFEEFDLILAMDHNNMEDLKAEMPSGDNRATLQLFGNFVDAERPPEVPDPYFGGDRGFDTVLDMVETGCKNLIDHILKLQSTA